MVGGYRDGWVPTERSCIKSLEFRDGVTCHHIVMERICHNHRVIMELREHAVAADKAELQAGQYRDVLAQVVGAFTSGIYCSNCGEGIETCRCIIDLARTALYQKDA
jgi:hypothetical protein